MTCCRWWRQKFKTWRECQMMTSSVHSWREWYQFVSLSKSAKIYRYMDSCTSIYLTKLITLPVIFNCKNCNLIDFPFAVNYSSLNMSIEWYSVYLCCCSLIQVNIADYKKVEVFLGSCKFDFVIGWKLSSCGETKHFDYFPHWTTTPSLIIERS